MSISRLFVRALSASLILAAGCTIDFAKLGPDEQHPPPVVSALNPASAFAGASITLTGTALSLDQGATTVTFTGGLTGAIQSSSATSLVVAVPDTAGNGPITVTTSAGKATSPAFAFLGPGEPRTNTLAGAIVFQAQPTNAIVTGEGGVLVAANNPLSSTGQLVLRALPGTENPVFAEGSSVPISISNKGYQFIYPMIGADVVALEPGVGAVEFGPPTGPVSLTTEWSPTGRTVPFTDVTDPNWTTLVAASLDSNRVMVVLFDASGSGWTAQARIINFGMSIAVPSLNAVMTAKSQTSMNVAPALQVSQDGTLAVLVGGDGHGTIMATTLEGPSVTIEGAVVSAAPLVDATGNLVVVVGRMDGSLDLVNPTTGAVTTTGWLGAGPVATQMFAGPGFVATLSLGLPYVSVIGTDGVPVPIPLSFTPCPGALANQWPLQCGMAASADGTAVLWDQTSTAVSKVSLSHREIEWATDISFVAANVSTLADGIVMNYAAPEPFYVGLAAGNLTAPALSQTAPVVVGATVADAARSQLWTVTPQSAIRQSVTLTGTPAITAMGSPITPPSMQHVVSVLPATNDAYVLSQDGMSLSIADSTGAVKTTVMGSGSVLAAADLTSSMIYVLLGSNLVAVDTDTWQSTTGNLAAALPLDAQTLDVFPAINAAAVTTGSQINFYDLTTLAQTSSLPLATEGAAHSPDGRFLYCVLTGAHGMATSLARVDMTTQALQVLFAMPVPGPTRQYAGAAVPVPLYSLSFAPGGSNLYIDNLASGDILHVD